jgi:putative methionine-R-sulfoxide reductase with GAF domain
LSKRYTTSEFEDILIYFSTSIMDKNSEEAIAWDVAKNCISKLNFVDCVIYHLNERENILVQVAAYGPKNPVEYEILEPIIIPVGDGITGSVAKNMKAEIIPDTSLDERYIIDDEIRLSEIAVPILLGNELYGVIDCEHPARNFFNEQHLKILSAIASICAIRIRSIRAEKKVHEQNNKLIETQIELLDLKVKALRSQMNPHFVFNSINAIQYFITINDKKNSLNYLSTFSKLIRYHLKYFEKDLVPLHEEINMLRWYLDLQKLRYTVKFDYQLTHRLQDHELLLLIPGKVIPSLIENAVENSMINNLENTTLDIYLIKHSDKLRVEVYCSQIKESKTSREFNYREDITPWEEQVDLLNRLKNLDIERNVTILNNGIDNRGEINITVSMPILS